MSETLELPPIDTSELDRAAKHAQAMAEQPAAQQPVIVVSPTTPDLTKIDLTDVALAMYGTWRKDVDAVKANLSTLVLDLSTPAKITEARSLRARLIAQPLAAARKVSQGIKSKMAATSKAVGKELEAIEAAYDEADKLILPKIEEREAELQREREEKAKAERERIERHQANIARIRAFAVRADTEPGMTAERIATGIKLLEDTPTPTSATWDEFAVEAANAICETLERMRITHARVQRAEQAEAEAAELRAKLAATEHTPQGANRDASAEQSHVAEGSTSPTGRGADGPTAGGAAPVLSSASVATVHPSAATAAAPMVPNPGSVIVSVGAGPITMIEPAAPLITAHARITGTDPRDELLREALALTKFASAPFFGKFPSHPKTTPEWWAGLREQIEALQPKLIQHIEGLA